MTFVVDASVAVASLVEDGGLKRLGDDLIAPPLMWSEARATLRLQVWQGRVPVQDGELMLDRLERLDVAPRAPARLGREAWAVARELGWARTYDAEYVALARLTGRRVVTLDGRLRRGADRLGLVVGIDEL
ncbi:type II toxin-antitoxin system VapC family toxin [Svornostia abyssi]|uniref:type II toxin-antitoxin system VapC family toxin n=1 Tax=Svornostia abyssi TaxID=2898438 RepID=UPI00338F0869